MKKKSDIGSWLLLRVQGDHLFKNKYSSWDRAYREYRSAYIKGWDWCALIRESDRAILYQDGTMPPWVFWQL